MNDLILRARLFAGAAHAAVGQLRKYTGEPYSSHCHAVAVTVWNATGSDDASAAAYLHDVLEDTKVTADVLLREFGPTVTDLVLEVTDVSRPEDGNRESRKVIDRAHNARASVLGQTIKVADLIENAESILPHDPGFASTYMADKKLLLEVLTRADADLLARAWDLVSACEHNRLVTGSAQP